MKAVTVSAMFPPRRADTHKGDFGKVLILGGSPGLTGAAMLCAATAVTAGAGLVTVGLPRAQEGLRAGDAASFMTWPLVCTRQGALSEFALPDILARAEKFDAVAFGPGAGTARSTGILLRGLLRELRVPLIIDADGINLLSRSPDMLNDHVGDVILTPHAMEMSRLTGKPVSAQQQHRAELAMEFAKRWRAVIVLKGPGTVVTDGHEVYVNATGNALLATGGSGDVLTGLILACLGRHKNSVTAAIGGVYVHGLAADLALKEGRAAIGSHELPGYISKVISASVR